MTEPLRCGVIGVGAMGRIHAQNLAYRLPLTTLAGVADADPGVAKSVAEALGVPSFASASDLIAYADAIVIATPRRFHAPLIEEAAAAGKHVFSEKPLASTLDECDAAISAVQQAGVKLQIGFHRRFDANFRAVHEAISSGEVGAPLIVHTVSRDPYPAAGNASRSADDLILETSIHDLDMARFLTGSEIAEVFAVPVGESGSGIEGMVLTLRMANGAAVTIDNHLHSAYGYDQRVEVFGSGGMVTIANETAHRARTSTRQAVTQALPLHFFAERYSDAYADELGAFAKCIADGTEPLVTGADGRAAVAAAVAALESLATGAPVRTGA